MDLNTCFQKIKELKIIVIGDVMIDSYLFGNVSRISPEAPVPIISVTNRENRLGGAANVALNLKSLGAEPILCSIIGRDDKAALFTGAMRDAALSSNYIMQAQGRKTTAKTRIISSGQHMLRVDDEITQPVTESLAADFTALVTKAIADTCPAAVIFEDYDKGLLTSTSISAIISYAKNAGIPVLVDPKKKNFCSYSGASLFKPNFAELAEGLKIDISKKDFDSIAKACNTFMEKMDIGAMMVTLSEHGVMLCDKSGYTRFPAKVRRIADVSGAGDTVISVAAAFIAAGATVKEAASYANIAGGLVCEYPGVVPIDKEQLHQEIIKHGYACHTGN
jgi:D-glycero-beta-D-manno-heptose-7-phosphate kinase